MNERLTKDIERPELTERKYKAINTCYYNSPAACADKLGFYENIDPDPTHLAKIKIAFEIIKTKQVNIHSFIQRKPKTFEEYQDIDDETEQLSEASLSMEEYELLKEVLL